MNGCLGFEPSPSPFTQPDDAYHSDPFPLPTYIDTNAGQPQTKTAAHARPRAGGGRPAQPLRRGGRQPPAVRPTFWFSCPSILFDCLHACLDLRLWFGTDMSLSLHFDLIHACLPIRSGLTQTHNTHPLPSHIHPFMQPQQGLERGVPEHPRIGPQDAGGADRAGQASAQGPHRVR